MNRFKTEQEKFWTGQFGNDYTDRNPASSNMGSRIALFADILSRTRSINKVIEFGANIGSNLKALYQLLPQAELSAIEINDKAVYELNKWKNLTVYHESIINFEPDYRRDLVFTSGVLIHINPDMLSDVYERLYNTSNRYICIIEYYNPTPVQITYRGYSDKLFKRDFAGELLDKYNNLRLIDYGFVYHRDTNFPLDDLTWFLIEKQP
ncbi:MAG: hypothetical protein JW786_03075 [Desulfobacterales bacterium]|nr:hypothetical protein [Desulfobacterales bacterium]